MFVLFYSYGFHQIPLSPFGTCFILIILFVIEPEVPNGGRSRIMPQLVDIYSLPEEILSTIFEEAVHFTDELNIESIVRFSSDAPVDHCKEWRATLPTRRSIVSVSRRWNRVGVPFLYRTIIIFHLDLIPRVESAFDEAPALAGLVKTMTMTTVLGHRNFHAQRFNALAMRCPNLVILHDGRSSQMDHLRPDSHAVPPFSTSLRALYFRPDENYGVRAAEKAIAAFYRVLRAISQNLECLHTTTYDHYATAHVEALNQLSFPKLTRLAIVDTLDHSLLRMISTWRMPRLRLLCSSSGTPQVDILHTVAASLVSLELVPEEDSPAGQVRLPLLENLLVNFESSQERIMAECFFTDKCTNDLMPKLAHIGLHLPSDDLDQLDPDHGTGEELTSWVVDQLCRLHRQRSLGPVASLTLSGVTNVPGILDASIIHKQLTLELWDLAGVDRWRNKLEQCGIILVILVSTSCTCIALALNMRA